MHKQSLGKPLWKLTAITKLDTVVARAKQEIEESNIESFYDAEVEIKITFKSSSGGGVIYETSR